VQDYKSTSNQIKNRS